MRKTTQQKTKLKNAWCFSIQNCPLILVKKKNDCHVELVMELKLKIVTYVLCILLSSPNISDYLDWTILSLCCKFLNYKNDCIFFVCYYIAILEIVTGNMKEVENN